MHKPIDSKNVLFAGASILAMSLFAPIAQAQDESRRRTNRAASKR